jgi:hypothetical protein
MTAKARHSPHDIVKLARRVLRRVGKDEIILGPAVLNDELMSLPLELKVPGNHDRFLTG